MLLRVDKVQLHFQIPTFDQYMEVKSQVYETAGLNGVYCHNGMELDGTHYCVTSIPINEKRLKVGVFHQYGKGWLMYRFNGAIDCAEADSKTDYLWPYNYSRALITAQVKCFELAADFIGLRAKDFLVHFKGASSSVVMKPISEDAMTTYSGSPLSAQQLVAYDKTEEQKAKGKQCDKDPLLRLELRLRHRVHPLPTIAAELLSGEPTARIWVIPVQAAISHKCQSKDWLVFVSACQELGVARALQAFIGQKKTFLKHLQSLQMANILPSLQEIRAVLEVLLPFPVMWEAIDEALAQYLGAKS